MAWSVKPMEINNLRKDLQNDIELTRLDKYEDKHQISRREAIETVLPSSASVYMEREGSYQGHYTLIVDYDGYYWCTVGSYGSCSACDAFIGAEHFEEVTEKLVRNCYCFKSKSDMKQYVDKKRDSVRFDKYPSVSETME